MDITLDHPRRHAITVEEFVRMDEAHVFGHDTRLELMDGVLVEMPPIGSPHASVVNGPASVTAACNFRRSATFRRNETATPRH